MTVVAFTDDHLHDYDMPGASPAVGMRRLHADDDGGFIAAVRFPPGFNRPGAGRYPVEEEFAVLEGRLEVSAHVYEAGTFVLLPAGYLRRDTCTDTGALAVARFAGPPAWTPSPTGGTPEGGWSVRWSELPETETPLGRGRRVAAVDGAEVWLVEDPPHRVPAGVEGVAISILDRTLEVLHPEAGFELTPPLLVRLRSASER